MNDVAKNSFTPPKGKPPKLMPGMVWKRKLYHIGIKKRSKQTVWWFETRLPIPDTICFSWKTGDFYLEDNFGFHSKVSSLEDGALEIERITNQIINDYCYFTGKIALKTVWCGK